MLTKFGRFKIQKGIKIALLVYFAYWWSCIGKGLHLQPVEQAGLIKETPNERLKETQWCFFEQPKALPGFAKLDLCKFKTRSLAI